jgi:hypothetical protein
VSGVKKMFPLLFLYGLGIIFTAILLKLNLIAFSSNFREANGIMRYLSEKIGAKPMLSICTCMRISVLTAVLWLNLDGDLFTFIFFIAVVGTIIVDAMYDLFILKNFSLRNLQIKTTREMKKNE